MNSAILSTSAFGPLRTLTTVGFPPPFALSLSKGQAEPVEASVPSAKGFDRLSPNGDVAGLRYVRSTYPVLRYRRISPNGSLRTLKFGNGP
jgi:hypothetical protein